MVRRRHRRSPFKKALIPLMLVMALIFSSVISVGFAEWQDKLTIETEVAVTGKPLTVELSKYYGTSDGNAPSASALKRSTSDYNWISYIVERNSIWYGYTYGALSYEIPANINGNTITIYNTTLSNNVFSSGSSATDGMGGIYSWSRDFIIKSFISFAEAGNAVGDTKNVFDECTDEWTGLNSSIMHGLGESWWLIIADFLSDYSYQFHGAAGVPVKVTFTNPNPWEVKITSAEIISGSGEATVETLPLTVPAKSGNTDGTAYAVINPSNYQNFVMRFTDENGKTYDVTVNFENYDSTVGASAASAAAYSYRPSTTTTTTTTVAEETTTVSEETTTSATTTETSAGETETTSTEATESTTSAETTTTTAPTSAAETTTTASTTAATAAVTTVPTSAATSTQAETQPTEQGAE